METRVLTSPDEAACIIREGGLCAFPTETVYGLGVDATNVDAVQRLFAAKGRPSDNPLIVHLGDVSQIATAASYVTENARLLLEAFAPGPITVVLSKQRSILDQVTGGLPTVGIRIPENRLARQLLSAVDKPVAAPSANVSGRPSCTTWQSVVDDLDGRIDGVLKGDPSAVGIESTVVDCTGEEAVLLRPGGVTLEQLQAVVPVVSPAWVASHGSQSGAAEHKAIDLPNSPGLRYRHYQPNAVVHLLGGAEEPLPPDLTGQVLFIAVGEVGELESREPGRRANRIVALSSIEEFAERFYELLRGADRDGFSHILLQRAPEMGLGASLLDRQRRAAAR